MIDTWGGEREREGVCVCITDKYFLIFGIDLLERRIVVI